MHRVSASTSTAPAPSFLTELRAATRDSHEALDERLVLQPGAVSLPRYAAFLRASLAVVEPVEARVAVWLGATDYVTRAECLRADLASLGEPPHASHRGIEVPAIASRAAAMGAAYVLEGSTLGGLFLARTLDRGLALEGRSIRYLTFRGERTKTCWREFLARIEAWSHTVAVEARTDACTTASALFRTYAESFERSGALG
jgi:heme oxygenase (biliverdin-IX-beta and delta-forming)